MENKRACGWPWKSEKNGSRASDEKPPLVLGSWFAVTRADLLEQSRNKGRQTKEQWGLKGSKQQ